MSGKSDAKGQNHEADQEETEEGKIDTFCRFKMPIFDKLSRIYQNLLLYRHIFKFFT